MNGALDPDRTLAWRQLLRVGNVYTAVANVLAGYLIVAGQWQPIAPLVVLAFASALIYAAGMALNDAYDAELDRVERPERPIPSGRISREAALAAGWALLAAGVACAALASWLTAAAGPIVVACCLAVMVVMYDGGLKNFWAGPLAMGWCRTLNVLLGGSLAGGADTWFALGLYAAAVGAYTVGLTLIARSEAGDSAASYPWADKIVVAACAVLFAWPWTQLGRATSNAGPVAASVGLFAVMIYAAVAVRGAMHAADPAAIRRGVKRLIVGFVLIDACAAAAAAGVPSGAAVLCLLLPTLLGARRAPMT
jgi:4-hydroxybenzoate polyprenyltransferase